MVSEVSYQAALSCRPFRFCIFSGLISQTARAFRNHAAGLLTCASSDFARLPIPWGTVASSRLTKSGSSALTVAGPCWILTSFPVVTASGDYANVQLKPLQRTRSEVHPLISLRRIPAAKNSVKESTVLVLFFIAITLSADTAQVESLQQKVSYQLNVR